MNIDNLKVYFKKTTHIETTVSRMIKGCLPIGSIHNAYLRLRYSL